MFRFVVLLCLNAVGLGLADPLLKIVAGKGGSIDKFKYQVQLEHMEGLRCGGTLIKADTVLTASHCLEKIYLKEFAIRAGTAKRSEGGEVIPVESYIIHPNYKKSIMVDCDVGLVFTKKPFTLGPTIQPAVLPEFNELPKVGEVATVSGWGRMSEGGPFAKTLQYLGVPVLDHKICRESYDLPLTDTMMCAGYLDGKRDACKQDSGGPLVCGNKVIGVVSWAIGCARPKYPGIYAHVAKFRKWIDCSIEKREACEDLDNKRN